MDASDCDDQLLANTYHQFSLVNRLLCGWRALYKRHLLPRLREGSATLLDVGCGGGDVARYLHRLAACDGLALAITGIDPDPRAIDFARRYGPDPRTGPVFLQAHSRDLADQRFDFVISNHVLHHLSAEELRGLADDSRRLARTAAIHNDIRRADLGYAGFWVGALPFRESFIRADGLTSIRRSYTRKELQAALRGDWQVEVRFPFRLVAMWESP